MVEYCIEMLKTSTDNLKIIRECRQCRFQNEPRYKSQLYWECTINVWKDHSKKVGTYKDRYIQDWVNVFALQDINRACEHCGGQVGEYSKYRENMLRFVAYNISGVSVKVNPSLIIQGTKHRLCGLIYSARWHFTSRTIDHNRSIWFNDGVVNGRLCKAEGHINIVDNGFLQKAKGADLTVILYLKL